MLIDHAKIYVFGGAGGKGCQSLFKDIFHRRGIPDGGDGGSGGNVVIESTNNLHTLLDYRYNQHHKADNGKHGGSNNKIGKQGKDEVLMVPVGTIVIDEETSLVMRDLSTPGERVIVAKGGSGGIGSARRKEATEGELGEEKTIILELKLLADVGIIGFPNAGKSTFITKVTKVNSKIAAYPFTTKSPRLGVVKYDDDSFVIADMPGIIEGAHQGKGLGDKFLKHIERTSLLVHMVDVYSFDETDPLENYYKLEKELKLYDEKVYNKPRIVVANKMDMPGAMETFERLKNEIPVKVWPISALTGDGVRDLVNEIYKKLRTKDEED